MYCGDEYQDFTFVADAAPIDPLTLAQSVRITPATPVVRTSPDSGSHLVNLESWFWVEGWQGLSETASVGPVSVTVSAAPSTLVIDPGDGTGTFTCAGPGTAYQSDAPAANQSSDCTHTYEQAGAFTATATVVYEVSFSSNVGVGGTLGTIEPDGTSTLTVRESQAIVTG